MHDIQKQQHIALCLTKILLRHHPEYIFGSLSGEHTENDQAHRLAQFCQTLSQELNMFNQLQSDDVNKIFHNPNQYVD